MNVLIVDDEMLIRRALGRVFESRGHRVELAEDGRVGLQKWKSLNPELVVLDILMPGLTGPEVLREMGKTKAKVILISAYTGHEETQNLKDLGVALFIQKPFNDIYSVVDQMEKV